MLRKRKRRKDNDHNNIGRKWKLTGKAFINSIFSSKFLGSLAAPCSDESPGLCRRVSSVTGEPTVQQNWPMLQWQITNRFVLTCFLGSNLMVSVCTRNGSNGGSCGFTGRKAENGTLTCTKQTFISIFSTAQPGALTEAMYLQMPLTLQNPTFVFIRAKYFLVCEVSASGPVSRIITYDLPFPPTERSNPSYLQVEVE